MTADIYVTHMFKVIYVIYMQFLITAVLHVCNIYVEIAAPSYIYVTCMYIYVTYMCGNGRYVTYMSHICRFGKGNSFFHVQDRVGEGVGFSIIIFE